jgi:serine/threonine protein phosphatase PrpC
MSDPQAPPAGLPVAPGDAPPDAARDAPPDAARDAPQDAAPDLVACPSCRTPAASGERFCESCGAELAGAAAVQEASVDPDAAPIELTRRRPAPAPPRARGVVVDSPDLDLLPTTCASCSGTIDDDGYCSRCGAPAPRPRDHFVEEPATWVVAVCDKGIRHARNEDAVALAARPEPGSFAALVVCDGVSSAPQSDLASLAAARAARDVLAAPATSPPLTPEELLTRSAEAANAAAARVASGVRGPNPPSCTFVAALVEADRSGAAAGSTAVVAWIGDSRAYWFPDTGPPVQLTTDDSWAAEAMAHGLPRAEAEKLPQAHAITRWLGADSPQGPPRTAVVDVSTDGWLLVCSDGLWNYCSAPEDLGPLVAATADRVGASPMPLAEALTAWANEQGGHDNITVALARCGGPAPG